MSVPSTLPPAIVHLAAQQQLGHFITAYHPRLGKRATFACVLTLAGGIGLGLYALAQPAVPFSGALLAFGLFALLGCAFLARYLLNLKLRVYVCAKGVIRTKGQAVYARRWDEIASVLQDVTKHYRNGVYVGTTHVYPSRPPMAPG